MALPKRNLTNRISVKTVTFRIKLQSGEGFILSEAAEPLRKESNN